MFYTTNSATTHIQSTSDSGSILEQPEVLDAAAMYQIMVSSILPRPIAWVSTISSSGVTNIAPYSFFTVASCQPPVLCITQVIPRDGHDKDTLSNLRETKEAVVNIVSQDLAEVMNQSCGNYAQEISEFEVAGIESIQSELVKSLGVRKAKVRYECNLREIKTIGMGDDNAPQPMGGVMLLLDVVAVSIADEVLALGSHHINAKKLQAIGKMGGDEYSLTTETFKLARPKIG